MADFSFEDALGAGSATAGPAAAPKAFSFEDAVTAPAQSPTPKIEEKPKSFSFENAEPSGPMPGMFGALGEGIKKAYSDVGQTVTSFSSTAPKPEAHTSPAAAPLAWGDALEPVNKLAPKIAYRLGESAPALGLGIAGGMAGSAAGTAVAPGVGTAAGGIGGGAAGAAAGAALQTLGPSFAQELKKTPQDPDGAWDRALHSAEISGAFSGASWAAFPIRAFQGPIKQLAFQAFGVQPAVSVAQQGVQNYREGKPLTEDLGQAYGEGAVMTAVPALGHAAVTGGFGAKAPIEAPTPQQTLDGIASKRAQAAQLQTDLQAAHVGPEEALSMQRQADTLTRQAAYEQTKFEAPDRIAQKNSEADWLDLQSADPKISNTDRADLQQRSAAMRQDARFDSFMMNLPPPMPERGVWAKSWIDNVQPELASDKALQADPLFARFKSATARVKDAILGRAEEHYYEWNKIPEEDVHTFLDNYERNQALPKDLVDKYPWMPERAEAYREMLKQGFADEKKYGSTADFLENYFPHLWKDPVAARTHFQNQNMPQALGPSWFQKARYYDLIKDGLDHGLELKTNNPEDLVAMRLMSGADMVEKAKLLQQLHENGVAVPAELAPSHILEPGRNDPNPWQQIKAPNGKQWMLAPDVQALWENAVVAKGLWANEGVPGNIFKKWMTLKNAMVPIKLGLSLFHPVHVAHISLSNNVSRALNEAFGKGDQTLGRRFAAVPEALAQTVGDLALAYPFRIPFTKIGTPHIGKDIRKAWLTPDSDATAQQQAYSKMMNESGISAQLSEQLRISAKRDFNNAINNGQYLKALLPGVRRALEKVSGPIFEQWIPNLKTAAVARETESLLRRRPDLINDEVNRLIAMRAIGKQVDNRFGEMFYGGLFWNRTMKDAAIGSFLSLGWNLGFAREFVGGALEPAARRMMGAPTPTRQLIRDVTNKSTNAFVYTMTAMAINAMINKSMTGENPDGMDYIFPRIGGLNPDGSPRRISNPFYTREVPMAEKNIEERQGIVSGLSQMLYHKMMFAPFAEMASNRNYFGYQIFDENAPFFKQAQQFGSHILNEQLNPMSISGAKRALELSGKPHTGMDVLKGVLSGDSDAVMPILGFGPAPGYASKDSIDNRISYLYNKFVAPSEKPFREAENAKERTEARTAYMMARQKGDAQATQDAALKLAQLGVKSATINKLQPGGGMQYMFQRLPQSIQVDLLKQMSADKFKMYFPKASLKTKADDEITPLARKYYGNSP